MKRSKCIKCAKIDSQITWIAIKNSYGNNLARNYKKTDVNTYLNYITKKEKFIAESKNKTSIDDVSLYEVLRGNKLKLYFDIECIPINDEKFIYKIIDDLKTFIKETSGNEINDYVLTMNRHSSSHEGLSYHLIFCDYYTKQRNIRNLLLAFLEKYKYTDFMDTCVYSVNRLFKSINQVNISKSGERCDENDKHELIHGSAIDSIIQYIDNCKDFNYEYPNGKKKGKRISDYKITNKNIERKIIQVLNQVNDDVIFKRNNEMNDKELYNLLLEKLNEKENAFIKECIDYYEKNGSFSNFKFSISMIKSLIEI